MERRQDSEQLHSEVTGTSDSSSEDLSISNSDSSPSHSDSGVDSISGTIESTPTGIPLTISWPSVETSSPLPTSLAGLSDSPSSFGEAASSFLLNKGAMAGVFAGLGVLLLSLFGIVYLGWIRRRRKYAKQRKSRDMGRSNASMTFSAIMRRFDANPAYRGGTEPRQTFSIQQTISRSAPSQRISVPSVSEWWARRRERRSSQFHQIYYHSRPPSIIDDDVKHLGEETQWTLGKVLEDQQQQVITPLPPVPRLPVKRPKPTRTITRALSSRASRSSRGRRSVGESEGGRFTLEDALLPSLSSSPVAYELGSSRSGRHPYAQA